MENLLITALALVLIIEGILPFIFPKLWRKVMREATELETGQLRLVGLTSMVVGVFILWLLT